MTLQRTPALRAVLHVHSTWSYDGHWSLGRLASTYGRLGIDAVLMTEHDTGFDPARFAEYRAACRSSSTPSCRLIPGIEYSSPDNTIHILTWGLDRFLAAHRPVDETLDAVRAGGGVAVLAHPARREAWRLYDDAWTPMLSAIELWNRKADGITWGPAALELLQRTGLPATVGHDFHRRNQLYPLTQVFPISPGPDVETAIVAALRAGRSEPRAFGRPLFQPDGQIRRSLHPSLEGVRRRVRASLLRRSP